VELNFPSDHMAINKTYVYVFYKVGLPRYLLLLLLDIMVGIEKS